MFSPYMPTDIPYISIRPRTRVHCILFTPCKMLYVKNKIIILVIQIDMFGGYFSFNRFSCY